MNKKLILLPALLMLLTSCGGGGGGGGKPAKHDGKTEETAFTAAEAIQAGKDLGLEVGQKSEDKFYIKDVVLSIKGAYSPSYGNISLNLGTADATFIAFQVGKLAADGTVKKIAATDKEAELQAGDTVCVYGQITQYQTDVWETPGQSAAGIVSYTFGPEHVSPATDIEVNVAQALTVINGLAAGATTSPQKYAVTGYITEITTEYSSKYGNISFNMADSASETDASAILGVYRCTCTEEQAALLVAGAHVTVTGILDNNSHGKQIAQGGTVVISQ